MQAKMSTVSLSTWDHMEPHAKEYVRMRFRIAMGLLLTIGTWPWERQVVYGASSLTTLVSMVTRQMVLLP